MKTDANAWTRRLALGLIVCAVAGAEISYHLTIESRFEGMEEKLAQQTTALQAMQQSLDTVEASKNETLSGLNRQLASLQSSFGPLGKTSQAQADALAQVHRQLETLQQAQGAQQDAQKNLGASIAQLEATVRKARAETGSAAKTPPAPALTLPSPSNPPVTVLAPAPATTAGDLMASPGAISHPADRAAAESIAAEAPPEPTAPRAQAVMDLRPADTGLVAPRALPVGGFLPPKR